MLDQRHQKWAKAAFAAAVLAACAFTLFPFFAVLAWGAVIALSCSPISEGLRSRGMRPGLAALSVCLLLALVVMLPLAFAAAQGVAQIGLAMDWAKSMAGSAWPALPAWAGHLPMAGPWLETAWGGLAKDGVASFAAVGREHAAQAASSLASIAGDVGSLAAKALFSLLAAGVFLAKADPIEVHLRSGAADLFGDGAGEWLELAAASARGVAMGVCGTALVISLGVAAGLAATGFPAVSLLSCVAMALCVAQIGPMPILIPACLYLAFQGSYGSAVGLAGLAVALSTVDGLLRPYLIGREVKMPMAMIFAGVVGGLVTMGMMGLFAGPMALAMGLRLWNGPAKSEAVLAPEARGEPLL